MTRRPKVPVKVTALDLYAMEEINRTLLEAASSGNTESVKMALHNGALVNCATDWGWTPLHLAAMTGDRDTLEILLKVGGNIRATDGEGKTPLHYAAQRTDSSICEILLLSGGDIRGKDVLGRTPLDLIRSVNVVKLMQSFYGEDILKNVGYEEQKRLTGLSTSRTVVYQQPYIELQKIMAQDSLHESFDMRVMVVGQYNVGKTTLVMLLVGEQIPRERLPTDGISLLEGKCGIDLETREWVKIKKDDYNAKDVVYNRVLMSPTQKENVESESKLQDLRKSGKMTEIPEINVDNTDEQNEPFSTLTETRGEGGTVLERGKTLDIHRLTRRKMKSKVSRAEFKKRLESALKRGTYKIKVGRLIFWDFGGQFVYYTTHQTFMSYRALFLVVFNGSKDLHEFDPNEELMPGQHGTPTSALFLQYWVNSILTYCKVLSGGIPKILFVATHKDKIPQKSIEEKRTAVFNAVEELFQDHEGRDHLVLEHRLFVNATDITDPEIESLKKIITDLTFKHPCWGEEMPNAWVPLELEIAEIVAKGEQIISLEELEELNEASKVSVLKPKDLKTFLLIQHSLGKIVYFDTPRLRDYVIISPLYMVEVMKSFITDKHFWPTDPKGKSAFEMMTTHGIIKKNDLFTLWDRKQFSKIFSHREFVFDMLIHLDILSEQRRYDLKTGNKLIVEEYFVPCMLIKKDLTDYMQQDCVPQKAIGLAFVFKGSIVPPALPNRLISACLSIWALRKYKDIKMLFSGLVVVMYDKSHEVVVCVDGNRISLFVVHERSRGLIAPDIATSVRECMVTSLQRISDFYQRSITGKSSSEELPFHVQHACPDLKCYSPEKEILSNKDLLCSGHGNTYEIDVWYQTKNKDICNDNCEGLSEDALCRIPIDTELLRLSMQLNKETMYSLAIHLGMTAQEWDDMQDNHPQNTEIVKFLTLIKWREKTSGTFDDVKKALIDMKENIHIMCKIRRIKIERSDIPEEHLVSIPTDEILDALAPKIGKLSFQLGVELGRSVSELETIEYNHKSDLVAQSRKILHNWRDEQTVKATFCVLEQALVNVGRGSLCLQTTIKEIGVKEHHFLPPEKSGKNVCKQM